ncbi:MAG: hypothetical protein PHX18_03825 [Candidatus Gastranaerophilales bacterium]|nr:hypothetical protein [Candidatus Gastranaerophilales bacterium]
MQNQGIQQNQQNVAIPAAQSQRSNPALSYLNNVRERVPADAFNKSALSAQQMSQLQQLEQAYQSLTPEQQMQLQAAYQQQVQQARSSRPSLLKPILFLALVGTLIFSAKARGIAKKPFVMLKNMITGRGKVTTDKALTEHLKNILEKAKTGILKKADIKNVSIRLTDMAAAEKNATVGTIEKLAREYSNCESGVPKIILKFKENTKLPDVIKNMNISDDLLKNLENISLINKGGKSTLGNDIDIQAIVRSFNDTTDKPAAVSGVGSKIWNFIKGLNS